MKKPKLADEALEAYFLACDSARSQARHGAAGAGGIDNPEATRRAREIWIALQEARVFVFEPGDYNKLRTIADKHTADLAKVELLLEEIAERQVISTQVNETLRDLGSTYAEHACAIPFPEHMPFDSVFLSFGKHLELPLFQAAFRLGGLNEETELAARSMRLNGFLLWTSGESQRIYTVMTVRSAKDGKDGTGFIQTFTSEPGQDPDPNAWGGFWDQPNTLDPWVVPMLVQAINDKKNITKETPGLGVKMVRKAVMKRSPGELPIPMPYYVTQLVEGYAEELAKQLPKPGRSLEWSHRWDVRGHDCVRIQMGELPIDPRIEKKLTKRGYKIYTGEVAPEHAELLTKRSIQRKPSEWLAILVYWQAACVKGPEGKPYVPSTRLVHRQ